MSKFLPDYTPRKTSLDRFIGCEAIMAERERRSKRKLVTFDVETKNVYMVVYEAVWINKKVEGFQRIFSQQDVNEFAKVQEKNQMRMIRFWNAIRKKWNG